MRVNFFGPRLQLILDNPAITTHLRKVPPSHPLICPNRSIQTTPINMRQTLAATHIAHIMLLYGAHIGIRT